MGDRTLAVFAAGVSLALIVELTKDGIFLSFRRIASTLLRRRQSSPFDGYWIGSFPIGLTGGKTGDHILEIVKIRTDGPGIDFRCVSYRYGESGFQLRRCTSPTKGVIASGTLIIPYLFHTGVPSEIGSLNLFADHPVEYTPVSLSGYFVERANDAMRKRPAAFYYGRLAYVRLPRDEVTWKRRLRSFFRAWPREESEFRRFVRRPEVVKAIALSQKVRKSLPILPPVLLEVDHALSQGSLQQHEDQAKDQLLDGGAARSFS